MRTSPLRTAVLLLLVAFGSTSIDRVAWAGDARDESAKVAGEHFRLGMVHFQLDEYAEAIGEWQEGFRVRSSSAFLYNIAKAYRLSKNPEKALSYYKKYLSMEPKAPNRAEVEGQIESLTKVVEAQAAAPKPEPVTPQPVVAQPVVAQSVVAQSAVAQPAVAPAQRAGDTLGAEAALTAHPIERKPITRKGWFWAVVVTSTVVVAGAVATGVYFGTRQSGTSSIGTVRF